MRKIIFLLILLTIMISGCKSPQVDICGDGVCSFIEKGRDNCPMDCTVKLPDLNLEVKEIPVKVDARANLDVDYTITNLGSAPSKYTTEFELYRVQEDNEYVWSHFSENSEDYLGENEKRKARQGFWIWEEGEYKIRISTSTLNQKDDNIKNNVYEKSILVSNANYPEYLIEEDFRELKYEHSSKEKYAPYLENINMEGLYTYNAEYRYDNSYVSFKITPYEQDITKAFVETYKNDNKFTIETFNQDILYVYSNEDNDQIYIEAYWVSNDKFIRLDFRYTNQNNNLDIEDIVKAYIDRYPSSIKYSMLCGDNTCNKKRSYIYEDNGIHIIKFNDGSDHNISFVSTQENSGNLVIDENSHLMNINDIISIQDQDIELDNLKEEYKVEFIGQESSVIFVLSDTIENGKLLNPKNLSLKMGEKAEFEYKNISYNLILHGLGETTAYIQIRDEGGEIQESEISNIGGIFVKIEKFDIIYESHIQPGMAILNLGENYQSCPQDCTAPDIKSEPTPIKSTSGSSGGSYPVQIGEEIVVTTEPVMN